ncbi:hypothetical protein HN51_034372 [Arachis hypogaea]|uniref:Uncharacterized protein n=1 Tax=Arachis hypogaea TaxID=3818 RepID=A0A445A8M9_ARAHY|nr:uncharacterized protein DS421_13g395930 [Arachis hypogaea]RYR22758.1 hypothetical protein Ahy_B03g068064 [Arachis hypogaea]
MMASWFSSLRIFPSQANTRVPSTTSFRAPKLCSCALGPQNAEPSEPEPDPETAPVDPVKLAFSKAKAYKESSNKSKKEDSVVEKKELPDSVKIAMEKAKNYKQNKSQIGTTQGLQGGSEKVSGNNVVVDNGGGKKGELSVSRIDFVGLDFADKKSTRGLPAGLVPISDSFSDGDFSEVELIVGDTSKFDAETDSKPDQANQDGSELYKPKVSTWGVFPRPNDISKTFGGGRTIRPGEVLETEEERAAKDARTKQLLAAYKKKTGLVIDPKLKSECEEALKEGDLLMNSGKLKEALPYYDKVMDNLPFQSELHGLAALQWSICQDSLSRSDEARLMYEKLQSHPNAKVKKRARQFMYSFQAMEMMKVNTGSPFYLKNTGYQNYFDAFVEDKQRYTQDGVAEENAMTQTFLYIIFLVSPIFVVLLIALQKRI